MTELGRAMNSRTRADGTPFPVVLEQLSSAFARVSPEEIDTQIEHWLEKICDSLELDRSVVAEFLPEKGGPQLVHQWTREGYHPVPMHLADEIIPWVTSRIRRGEAFVVPSSRSLPTEADRDREFALDQNGPKATVLVPLMVAGNVIGGVSFADLHRQRRWSPALLRRLKLIADILANAMERQRSAIEAKRLQAEAQKLANFALLGEMSSAMAHELNHPLGSILANAQAGRRMLERPRPNLSSLKEVLDDIIAGERRASKYVEQVRNVFGNGQLRTEPLQVDKVFAAAAALVRSDMMMLDISLEIDIEAGLPTVNADRTAIEQVMLNLLRNAADAIGNSTTRFVRVRAFRQDLRYIRVTVADTGGGIDQDDLDRIFEPLFTTKEKGTGMGLTIVRSIVQAHGGQISVRTGPKAGAIFEFTVPVSN